MTDTRYGYADDPNEDRIIRINELERALAEAQAEIDRKLSPDIYRGLCADLRLERAYAQQLRELLTEAKWYVGSMSDPQHPRAIQLRQAIEAALAKNPNPSGQSSTEASSSLRREASGPVGLGPDVPVTGQFPGETNALD